MSQALTLLNKRAYKKDAILPVRWFENGDIFVSLQIKVSVKMLESFFRIIPQFLFPLFGLKLVVT